jgi:uncharacterized repeat protein (TIGR01451 family)
MALGTGLANGGESAKQSLSGLPCNFNGVLPETGDTPPLGDSIVDYNLTDYYGGTWVDAEKTADNPDDDLMCWAAGAANILEWTGWGFVNDPIEGQIKNSDEMFHVINHHWEDLGADAKIALVWWFNGSDISPSGWAHVDVAGGGNYWPGYNVDDYMQTYAGPETLEHIDTYLSSGMGVALGIYDGGHCITCWGIKFDDTVNKTTDPHDYYKGVYVTDSDNNKWANASTPPPDTIEYYNVTYNSTSNRWDFTDGYGGWHIEDVYALAKNPSLDPDLAIYKTASPDVVTAGEELTYNITVANLNEIVGGVTAYNVVVTDTLPAGVTYIADTGGCELVSGNTYNCSIGNIAPGDSVSFTISVRVNADYVAAHGHTMTNTATVTSDSESWEKTLTNNQVTTTTLVEEQADLTVVKLAKPDTTLLIGQVINYTIIIENQGPSLARAVNFTDEIRSSGTFTLVSVTAPGWTVNPTSGTRQWITIVGTRNTNMEVDDRDIIQVIVQANESQDINDIVTVDSATPDPDLSNNQALKAITVTAIPADLKVTKFVKPDTSIQAGTYINCTIIVENLGPNYAYNVSIRDEIVSSGNFQVISLISDPARSDTISSITPSPGVTIEASLLVALEPMNSSNGGRWVLQIILQANETQDINDEVNVFTTTSQMTDPDLSNNEAEASIHVTAAADIELTKTATPTSLPYPNRALNYTIVVTNNGPSTAVNVIVKDWLFDELSIFNITCTKGSVSFGVPGDATRPVVWTVGSLTPGENATMLIWTTLTTGTSQLRTDVVTIRNDAAVTSDTYDPDNSNNLASKLIFAGSSPTHTLPSSIDPPTMLLAALTISIVLASLMLAMRIKKTDPLSLMRKRLGFPRKTNET